MSKKINLPFRPLDPVIANLAKRHLLKLRRPVLKRKRFEHLATNILYQQLSTKVADVIAARFVRLFNSQLSTLTPNPSPSGRGGLLFPSPQEILAMPEEKMRAVGISWAKIKYIKDLALHVANFEICKHVKTENCKHINLHDLHKLSDDEVIVELTKVKGIGRWTAEMFLMSALDRPDVFSLGDLGLRTAIMKNYGYKKMPSNRTIVKLSNRWRPYRTYAARLLWASLDA